MCRSPSRDDTKGGLSGGSGGSRSGCGNSRGSGCIGGGGGGGDDGGDSEETIGVLCVRARGGCQPLEVGTQSSVRGKSQPDGEEGQWVIRKVTERKRMGMIL